MMVLEAMPRGVPVVATGVGGVAEAVEDGKSGLLVHPNDPTALADTILRLLDNENLRRSMGQAARQRAIQLFSWDKAAQDQMEVFKGLESQSNRSKAALLPRHFIESACLSQSRRSSAKRGPMRVGAGREFGSGLLPCRWTLNGERSPAREEMSRSEL